VTGPQERMLKEVRAAGTRTYNGRARRTVTALEEAGLVEVEYDLVPHAKGNGISFTERFIVTAKEKA